MTVIAISRSVGPIPMDVIVREKMEHTLNITRVPVESGATITDHALLEPMRVELEVADGNAAATWAALDALQRTRQPFAIVTGLRVYTNMLISRMEAERDEKHAFILSGKVELQEIILVSSAMATSPGGAATGPQGAAAGVTEGVNVSVGLPGGIGSVRAALPVPDIVSDLGAAARAASTIVRGDSPVQSLVASAPAAAATLQRVFA